MAPGRRTVKKMLQALADKHDVVSEAPSPKGLREKASNGTPSVPVGVLKMLGSLTLRDPFTYIHIYIYIFIYTVDGN